MEDPRLALSGRVVTLPGLLYDRGILKRILYHLL